MHALYTLADDNFVPICKVLLRSFFDNNSWFTGDVVILHEPTHCALSEESQVSLSEVVPEQACLVFHEVDFSSYEKLFATVLEAAPESRLRTLSCLLKWDIFKNTSYNKSVYLDADTLVLNDISFLFEVDQGFVACADGLSITDTCKHCKIYNPGEPSVTVNGGMYSVNSRFTNSSFFEGLITHSESLDFKSFYKKLGKGRIGEQDMVSLFLRYFERRLVSTQYNIIRRALPDICLDNNPDLLPSLKIIHYTSKKPNAGYNKIRLRGKHRDYKKTHDLWMNYYER